MPQQFLKPGEVVSVPEKFYRHLGIDLGDGTVIHASKKKRKVVCEPMGEFAEGKQIRYEGYPGKLPPEQVIDRASELIGQPFRLFSENCEHLVTHAHGLKRRSPQVESWLIVAGVVILALVVAKKVRVA